jgi:hypothetical protein
MRTLDEAIQYCVDVASSTSDNYTMIQYDQLANWLLELKEYRLAAGRTRDIKLYLDDERDTPEGWVRVYGIEQAKTVLRSRRVSYLSVDNDLGNLDPKTEGFNLLDWLEESVYNDPTFPIPIITVHSSNAGRTPAMRQTAAKLEKIRQEQVGGE